MSDETPYEHTAPYKMATICHLTDFSPALLRAWERRHHLLRPGRGPGGHRLYTQQDLQVLLRVKEMLGAGRSIGELARLGRDRLLKQSASLSGLSAKAPAVVAIPTSGPEARDQLRQFGASIVHSAMQLDSGGIEAALDQSFARFATDTVVFEVIAPAAREIGELWTAGRCTIAHEHLASGIFLHRLLRLVESARPTHSDVGPVVVACFPDEHHQLGALALAYMMSRNGVRVSYLGADLPFDDLESGCQMLRPGAVLLSVTRSAIYQLHRTQLAQMLRKRRGEMPFYLGGQGVPQSDVEVQQAGAYLTAPGTPLNDVISEILGAVRAAKPAR